MSCATFVQSDEMKHCLSPLRRLVFKGPWMYFYLVVFQSSYFHFLLHEVISYSLSPGHFRV